MHSLSLSISFTHPPNSPAPVAFQDLISVTERILRTVISDSFQGDTRTKMEDLKRLKAG